MERPDVKVASWHWPSTVSPKVDREYLEDIRGRSSPLYFAREYLAEWVDEAGAFFTTAELEAALDDYELVDPSDTVAASGCGGVVGGVDWGGRRDANALCIVAALSADGRGRSRFWLPFLEERFDLDYDGWIDRLLGLAGVFQFQRLCSETNGVGQMPTEVLGKALWQAGRSDVALEPVTTTARSKENAFGFVRLLLQQGRLRLPRHTGLLKQLAALEYEATESGGLRIAVPERAGHDDLAMSLALAVSPLMAGELAPGRGAGVMVSMEELDDEVAGFSISPL